MCPRKHPTVASACVKIVTLDRNWPPLALGYIITGTVREMDCVGLT